MTIKETIFCVAPGPSIDAMDLEPLRDRRVLAIKWGFLAAPWCEAIWSTHAIKFYRDEKVKAFLLEHPDCKPYAMRSEPEGGADRGIATLELGQQYGLCTDPGAVAFGKNSGHSGINLAYHMLKYKDQRSRIVLIGYDMRIVEGRSHFHREKATCPAWQYKNIFVPAFHDIALELQSRRIECLNATPNSALEAFPHIRLKDAL